MTGLLTGVDSGLASKSERRSCDDDSERDDASFDRFIRTLFAL